MKRTITLLSFLLFSATVLFANPVDPEKALETATEFWKSKVGKSSAAGMKRIGVDRMSKAAGRIAVEEKNPQFYLFTAENNNGFVIVSGEDELPAIVGYSTDATNYATEMPDALVAWLGEYSEYVDEVRAGIIEPVQVRAAAGTRVEPMLKTSWNQGTPYNNMCPTINGSLPPSGCTATAMTQIMKFHEWPEHPKTSITWKSNITGETEYINIASHYYDWANMLEHYRGSYTQEQADAVALLTVDVGKAIGSSYGLSGTGSNEYNAAMAMVNVFNYSSDVVVVRRGETTEEEFVALIRENLEARQPVMFTGQGQSFSSGHAFVCDGIDEENLLHIDWGWDGSYNGFFDMTYMQPEGTGTGGGSGRYNVAQAIIANIHPKESGERGRAGDPTLYDTRINDPVTGTELDEYVADASTGTAEFKITASFLNWSHSTVNTNLAFALENENGNYEYSEIEDFKLSIDLDKAVGYNISFNYDISGKTEGCYNIKLCYKQKDGSYKFMPGDNNMVIEVGSGKATLRKATPDVELSNFDFLTTPLYKGDRLSFTAEFVNRNKANSTVLIVPVLNKQEADGSYSQEILVDNAALVDVYDNRDIYVEFDTYKKLNYECNYYVSFMFNMRNYYTNHEVAVETEKLIGITGCSNTFAIKAKPAGAVPEVTDLIAQNVTVGKKMTINAVVKNIASTNDAYTGVLGLFIKNTDTGKETHLATFEVAGLAKGSTKNLSYSSSGYFPYLLPGKYIAYLREKKEGWNDIKHSSTTCKFSILNTQGAALYAAGRIDINGGNNVRQGSSFDVNLKIGALNGDFDGFVRVSMNDVTNPLGVMVKSDYIPVTIKDGETADVTLPCTCIESAKLGLYELDIIYYNSSKKRIGNVSNNNLSFPDNGDFWIADATAIESAEEANVSISASNGCIVAEGINENAVVTVYSVDGREAYKGNATSISVVPGMYIVVVDTPQCKPVRAKVCVGK